MTQDPSEPGAPGPLDIVESIAEALIAMDCRGHVSYANPAAQRMLGMSLLELQDLTCHDLCGCDQSGHHCFLREVVGWGKIYREEAISLLNLTGAEIKAVVTASPIIVDGEIIGGVQIFRVVSHSGSIVRKLEKLAGEDELTGLLNRRELMRRFEVEIARADRHRRPLSVLMMDLDHFKEYNDAHGHLAGDEALKLAAAIIKDNSRTEDIPGRYGGEEFLLVLPETAAENAQLIAERIRRSLAQSEELDPPITLSIGVYTWPGAGPCSAEKLISRADRALYESKRCGRNRVTVAAADEVGAG